MAGKRTIKIYDSVWYYLDDDGNLYDKNENLLCNINDSGEYILDNFDEKFELLASDVINVQRWKQLKAISERTGEEESEFVSLTNTLSSKIVTSEDWNLLLDAMFNLEKAYVDKGLDQIDSTVENYVENYAQTDINNKLGTIINNLLLTNATQIIISDTQPTTVTNGALWIKPKTT